MSNGATFKAGDRVFRVNDPARIGIVTGKFSQGHMGLRVEVAFPDSHEYVYDIYLRHAPEPDRSSPSDLLNQGIFGQAKDLRRLMTCEKLKGTLSEMIYAMDSADIEFMPYQYKPVLKFIESINDRLLLADEVGLGKTIEAGLIWQELRMRKNAKRLLVLCPKTLASNWKSELLTKFSIKANIVDAEEMHSWIEEAKASRGSAHFALIATYSNLRVTNHDLESLEKGEEPQRHSGLCYGAMEGWSESFPFADLAIFDEAHILRNRGSNYSRTAMAYSKAVDGLVCVSATPINNTGEDLYTLLSILDPDMFESVGAFNNLVRDNQPSVKLSNALSAVPFDWTKVETCLAEVGTSGLAKDAPLLSMIAESLKAFKASDADGDKDKAAESLFQAQRMADQLNLLSKIISRTRRRQVKEMPAVRDVTLLTVSMNEQEKRFYMAVTSLIRKRLTGKSGKVENGRFLAFGSISPQLRMASSMPVMVDTYRQRGMLGDVDEVRSALQSESGDDADETSGEDSPAELEAQIRKILADFSSFDFESNDSKFAELAKILAPNGMLKAESKLVVFSYFRGTLAYLERRLNALGVHCCVLHGGINDIAERQELIDHFRSAEGPRVLLSSEVGSEGFNLQFWRCVINYDLPWNPMRVEQRIGRIDRVGQKAERLSIIHFKVPGTIDACVYEKLYGKIAEAQLTIGEMEDILGKEIESSELIKVMFDDKKTDAEREMWLEQQMVQKIKKAKDLLQLEEKAEIFEGLTDFIRSQIDRGRRLSRYVTQDELLTYVKDFFDNEGAGSQFALEAGREGLYSLSLSDLSYRNFAEFCRKNHPEAAPRHTDQRMLVTFDKEVMKAGDRHAGAPVVLLTGTAPMVRWITASLNNVRLHPTFKVKVHAGSLGRGFYYCLAEKWNFRGRRNREVMRYFIVDSLNTSLVISGDSAEQAFLEISKNGDNLTDVEQPLNQAECIQRLVEEAAIAFAAEERRFVSEDRTFCQIQLKKIEEHLEQKLNGPAEFIKRAEERIAAIEGDFSQPVANRQKAINRIKGQIAGQNTRRSKTLSKYLPKIDEAKKLAENDVRDTSRSEAAVGLVLFG
jgi:SNF2 family DNA or RNA helicase